MIEQIGMVAGKVWSLLSDNEQVTIAQLKKQCEEEEFLVIAAIGWLAREDKIELSSKGRGKVVKLK